MTTITPRDAYHTYINTLRNRGSVIDDLVTLGLDRDLAHMAYTLYVTDRRKMDDLPLPFGDDFKRAFCDIMNADQQDDGSWKPRIPTSIGWYDGQSVRFFDVDTDRETLRLRDTLGNVTDMGPARR
ncbi:MAG: hypothetical protein F4X11_03150 [Acidobacteria bacterium]|nr:hypothetical protein [Acidobacteriota bacterium]